MRQKLVLVSWEKPAMEAQTEFLQEFFSGQIEVVGYYINGNQDLPRSIEGNLILLTAYDLIDQVRHRIRGHAHIIYIERTLSRSQMELLKEIPTSLPPILLDHSLQTAKRLKAFLQELGVDSARYMEAGLETPNDALLRLKERGSNTLITAGAAVPAVLKDCQHIALNWIPIDAKSLMEISVILNLYNETIEDRLCQYMKELATPEKNIMLHLKSTIDAKNTYHRIMEQMEDGVLISDKDGLITDWNSHFLTLLGIEPDFSGSGEELALRLPQALQTLLHSSQRLHLRMTHFAELQQDFFLTRRPIGIFGSDEGYITTVKEIADIQRQEAKVRRQMSKNLLFAKHTFDDILGDSPQISRCKEMARRIAGVDATVLITGESGTGKELFAQAIHNASARKRMPFVAINCAALNASLLESELFGYEAGAFTNASSSGHIGLFETAHRGSIFLDEIGELPLNMQTKLLRVLEEREIRRVGGRVNIPIDVRVIAATNQDLGRMIREKSFRADLYYRLNILPLSLPSLRERQGDITLLTRHFVDMLGGSNKRILPELWEELEAYPWEGNIRELFNCVQFMVYLSDDVIDPELFRAYTRQGYLAADAGRDTPTLPRSPLLPPEENERRAAEEIVCFLRNRKAGREEITTHLRGAGIELSEYRVRILLEQMKDAGIVLYGKGRGGVTLAE